MIESFNGTRVTVMGLGRFGGGAGVTRWLVEQGAHVLLTDQLDEAALYHSLESIADVVSTGRVELKLGGHDVCDFESADCVIANPGVAQPWSNEYLIAARDAGVPVTTEIRLLADRIDPKNVIGITGTVGKSTTAAMIHHVLQSLGHRSHLGGNIGGSVLDSLQEVETTDWIVLELSSAMLHWLGEATGHENGRGWSPRIAVITNVSPNHVDWHGSIDHYYDSKANIARYQQMMLQAKVIAESNVVQQPQIGSLLNNARTTVLHVDDPSRDPYRVDGTIELAVPGVHNQTNARFAVTAALAALEDRISIDAETIEHAHQRLITFEGLPHRLRCIAECDDMRFFDDSKSSTPGATVLAVDAFDDASHVHLIAGGYDKQIDVGAISGLVTRLGGLYTIGATGSAIAAAASGGNVIECDTLERAVEEAFARMSAGDTLLLSPGCASWDQFDNFQQRGERFRELVEAQLTARTIAASR